MEKNASKFELAPRTEPGRSQVSTLVRTVSGVLAAGMALGVGELTAALINSLSLVVAVANRIIDYAPVWFVDFGKNLFGLADKPALILGTVITSAILGALLTNLHKRSSKFVPAGFGLFGLVGWLSVGSDEQGGWVKATVIALCAVTAGIFSAKALLERGSQPVKADLNQDADPSSKTTPKSQEMLPRRNFMAWAGGTAAFALGAVGLSRLLTSSDENEKIRESVSVDPIEDTEFAKTIDTANSGTVGTTEDITPIVVQYPDFYKIDTTISNPQADIDTWTLRIHGMVDSEVSFSYQDLLDRSTTVAPVTLSCVSNPVGDRYVGNAIWQGVPLKDLLDEAGVNEKATQIASTSIDGWNCGFPTEAAYDGRTALVAVGMNGEPLPLDHGFPARLVVSGLYGYVSATKWLKEIELTTLEAFNGFWIEKNWAKFGPIKTQSRIDTPKGTATAGSPTPIAGIAWAPNTGITKVEVQVDDEPWAEADLGESLGKDAWVQWRYDWTPQAGEHTVRVRATDETGQTQTDEIRPPRPDGATGWHTVNIEAV